MEIRPSQDLFTRFGGVRPMARALDRPSRPCGASKVHSWKKKRAIPQPWQGDVLEIGNRLNLEITAEDVMFPFPEDRGVN